MLKKKIALVLVLLLFLPLSGCIEKEKGIKFQVVDFDQARCLKDVEVLTEIGPRLTGNKQEKEASTYIKERFEEAGLSNIQIEEYGLTCFEVKKANLSILSGGAGFRKERKTLEHGKDFVLLAYSGSTHGSKSFGAVLAGNGIAEDYEGLNVRNKAVLVEIGGSFADQLAEAMEHGASACLIHNTLASQKIYYLPISGTTLLQDKYGNLVPFPDVNPNPIPLLMISYQVGKKLKQAIENPKIKPKIKLDIDAPIFKGNLSVVSGEILGSTNPAEFVLIGAHHDSVYLSPGAVNNAAGCATVIELARQLSNFKPAKTIKFATWGGEEEGRFDSTKWAEAHEDELKNLIVYFNIDQNNVNLERGSSLWFFSNNGELLDLLERIKKSMESIYPEIKRYKIHFDWSPGGIGGDDLPFVQRLKKITSVYGSGNLNWEYHTPLDRIEYVYPESLAVTGYLYGSLALWLAS